MKENGDPARGAVAATDSRAAIRAIEGAGPVNPETVGLVDEATDGLAVELAEVLVSVGEVFPFVLAVKKCCKLGGAEPNVLRVDGSVREYIGYPADVDNELEASRICRSALASIDELAVVPNGCAEGPEAIHGEFGWHR